MPTTFVANLAARGMAVTLDGKKIIIRPAALLTDTDRDFIRTNKAAIVAALAIPAQSDPPAEKTAAAKGANSHDFSEFDSQHQPAGNRRSNRIFDVGAAGVVGGMPWPAAWGDPGDWSDAEREALQERAAIREFDGGMARADAERAAMLDVRPTTRPGGLIDALAADGLLHPRGIITTTADGKRTWQHPDFDAVECARAMADREAPATAKWDTGSGRFVTNRDTDCEAERGMP